MQNVIAVEDTHTQHFHSRKKEGMNVWCLIKYEQALSFWNFTFSASLGTIVHCWPS